METPKLLSTIILEAHDSLTEETWVKGSYFFNRDGMLCFCSHGAVQRLVNPKVREILSQSLADMEPKSRYAEASCSPVDSGAAMPAENEVLIQKESSVRDRSLSDTDIYRKVWDARPLYVREGNLDAHYLLGMVGLTGFYNDNHTLPQVKAKFMEAYNVALQLGV